MCSVTSRAEEEGSPPQTAVPSLGTGSTNYYNKLANWSEMSWEIFRSHLFLTAGISNHIHDTLHGNKSGSAADLWTLPQTNSRLEMKKVTAQKCAPH